jgi:hypothetical protein
VEALLAYLSRPNMEDEIRKFRVDNPRNAAFAEALWSVLKYFFDLIRACTVSRACICACTSLPVTRRQLDVLCIRSAPAAAAAGPVPTAVGHRHASAAAFPPAH